MTDVARGPAPDTGDQAPGDQVPSTRRPRKQEQEPAAAEVTEVAPDVIRMQLPIWMPGLGHVNMYGLLDDRGLAVVDPGLPGPQSWKALKARLRSAGFRLRDVHTVVVTHSHPDHFGGAGRLAKESGAELLTHRAFITWSLERKYRHRRVSPDDAAAAERAAAAVAQDLDVGLEGEFDDPLRDDPSMERQRTSVPWGEETPWGGSRHPMPPWSRRVMIRALRMLFTPPDPTRRVVHGEPVRLAGREWTALHTPGHTIDHLCLYDNEHGLLLSGDHVLPTITPHVSGVANDGDALRSYIATLDLVAGLEGVRRGLPAHGHPFDDVPGRVEAIKRHHHERMEKLHAASVALGPATVQDLAHELFPRKHWGVMAESETFAHLEHLVREGRVERHRDGGRLVYLVADP